MADVTLSLNGSTPVASPDPVRVPKGGNVQFEPEDADAMFMVIAKNPEEFNGPSSAAPPRRGGTASLHIKGDANPRDVKYFVVYQKDASSDVFLADPIIVIEEVENPRRG